MCNSCIDQYHLQSQLWKESHYIKDQEKSRNWGSKIDTSPDKTPLAKNLLNSGMIQMTILYLKLYSVLSLKKKINATLLQSDQLMSLKHIPAVQCTSFVLLCACEGHNQEEVNFPPAVITASAKKNAKHECNIHFLTDTGFTLPAYFS